MNGYGFVRVGGDVLPLTLRGFVVFVVVGALGLVGVLWGVVVLCCFAFTV